MNPPSRDRCGRTMGDLRLSVIDQCNLRCRYCMPEAEYAWLPRADLLSVDEISLIVDAFIAVGVDKIRLTGGEPLIRSDLAAIIEVISAKLAMAAVYRIWRSQLMACCSRTRPES